MLIARLGSIYLSKSVLLYLSSKQFFQNSLLKGKIMAAISDEYMKQMLTKSKNYSIVILRAGPNRQKPGAEKIVWEHGRRNFSLRSEGLLSIVCPVIDNSDLAGIGIFNADAEETKRIMDDDTGVKEGIFVYEIHPCRSFPGDSLP